MAAITATGRKTAGRGQRGFGYVGLLIGIAILAGGLASVATVWHTFAQREQEKQLLFIGNQFRGALKQFYVSNQRYPTRLEQLVQDDGKIVATRYLRKLFFDPMTGKTEWGTVKLPGGQIVGVYSLSEKTPLKIAGFRAPDAAFRDAKKYADWIFIAEGQAAVSAIDTLKSDALKIPTISFK